MQLGLRVDGQDDEQVPCYGDQVYDEEEDKEWLLILGPRGESQEDESETLLVWLSLSIDLDLLIPKTFCSLLCSDSIAQVMITQQVFISSIWSALGTVQGRLANLLVFDAVLPSQIHGRYKCLMLQAGGTEEEFSFKNYH